MVLPFLREVASEGRKSFPHRLAIGEAEAGTGVREVEVADGAAVVFQMTQEAWILGGIQCLKTKPYGLDLMLFT